MHKLRQTGTYCKWPIARRQRYIAEHRSSIRQQQPFQLQSYQQSEKRILQQAEDFPVLHRTYCVHLLSTQAERANVERAIVKVRGVISLVFDLPKSRIHCRVRRMLDLSKLGAAVNSLGSDLILYQIVSKAGGEEVMCGP